jgi:hypothetical protein
LKGNSLWNFSKKKWQKRKMLVNQTEVVDRHNRPNVSQRVGLRTFFINDGVYVDGGQSPIHCIKPVDATGNCIGSFDKENYHPAETASGIYRLGVGEYVVVLDQITALSGWDWNTNTQTAASSLSSVNQYVDLWTVKLTSGSKYQVITNEFSLYEDTFFAFTEPLLLTTNNKLMNKHVRYKEIIDIKVSTEVTLQNKNVSESVQNIFKDSVVSEAFVTIKKVNHDPNFEGPFTVVDGIAMDITGDNTLIYNWDTLTSIGSGSETFGIPTGTYSVQVDYTVLNQTIKSPLYYLTVS